jgi:hypothetical protein
VDGCKSWFKGCLQPSLQQSKTYSVFWDSNITTQVGFKHYLTAVYFDQQMGASHAVYWSKLLFLPLFNLFPLFLPITDGNLMENEQKWAFLSVRGKKGKRDESGEKSNCDQRTACEAPVCWSKYTTLDT